MRYMTFATLLFLAGGAVGVTCGIALSQSTPQLRVDELLQRVVAEIPQPTSLRVHDDRWDPGAETTMHDHPGPVILAVIEGELSEDTPGGQNTLRAGQVYWRSAREKHNVRNVSGKPARILAIHFDPVP